MLLWLSGCIWIGDEAHQLRLDEAEQLIVTDLTVQSDWDRCAPPPIDVSFGVPDTFVGRTGTVELALGAVAVFSAEVEVTERDGGGWVELLQQPVDNPYENVGLSTTAEITITLGRVEGEAVLLDLAVPPPGFIDGDGDGFGEELAATCEAGVVEVGGDCDDADPAIHPAMTDDCGGGDEDCDGEIDEDTTTTVYTDADGDLVGDDTTAMLGCPGPGFVTVGGDCNDNDGQIAPTMPDLPGNLVDEDCDGLLRCGVDLDGDGASLGEAQLPLNSPNCPAISLEPDCDDDNPDLYPDNDEVCDAIDNDCDSLVDDDDTDLVGSYPDLDGDGFGNPNDSAPCNEGVADNSDCDDGNLDTYLGAPELCDGLDNDCNGVEDAVGIAADGDAYPTLAAALATNPNRLVLCEDVNWDDTQTFTNPLEILGAPGVSLGGPVVLPPGVDVVLDGLIVAGSTTLNGGAISSEGASLTVRNCEVRDGQASGMGGGIYIRNGFLEVSNTVIRDNFASTGGGIYAENTVVTLDSGNLQILSNVVTGQGGGIALVGGGLQMTGGPTTPVLVGQNTAVSSLPAGQVGAAIFADGTEITAVDARFESNQGSDGGAIDITNGGLTCTRCAFDSNTDYDVGSGPLYNAPTSAPISIECAEGMVCAPF